MYLVTSSEIRTFADRLGVLQNVDARDFSIQIQSFMSLQTEGLPNYYMVIEEKTRKNTKKHECVQNVQILV